MHCVYKICIVVSTVFVVLLPFCDCVKNSNKSFTAIFSKQCCKDVFQKALYKTVLKYAIQVQAVERFWVFLDIVYCILGSCHAAGAETAVALES